MKKTLLLLSAICLMPNLTFAEPKVIDQILAIVNDKIILLSEVDETVNMYFAQAKKEPSQEEKQEARQKYRDQMVENILLVESAKTQGIVIQSAEVNQSLEESIGRIRENFPSQEAFESELAKEGLTIADLRRRYAEDIRNQLMINRLVDDKIRSQVEVSAHEIRQMYTEKQAELPQMPEQVTVSHILIPIEVTGNADEKAQEKARMIRQKLMDGADFSETAKTFSQGPGAENGGDLGYFGVGDMLPEFEKAVLTMKVGEISQPVNTSLGYHLIKVNDKKDDKIAAAHILIKIGQDEADSLRALQTAKDVLAKFKSGAVFSDLAKQYSVDENTRNEGGALGKFSLSELVPPYNDAVKTLQIGEVSEPVLGDFGYHLIRVDAREAPRPYSFNDVRPQLEDMVRQSKMAVRYESFIEDLKKQNYIELRPLPGT